MCSSLRVFLRFLHTTGRLRTDLASGVMAPRFRASERPPRTLPWQDVRRILQVIRRSEPRANAISRCSCSWQRMVWVRRKCWAAIGRLGLAGGHSQGTQAEDQGVHRTAAVAASRKGVDRVLAVGASTRQGYGSSVPE